MQLKIVAKYPRFNGLSSRNDAPPTITFLLTLLVVSLNQSSGSTLQTNLKQSWPNSDLLIGSIGNRMVTVDSVQLNTEVLHNKFMIHKPMSHDTGHMIKNLAIVPAIRQLNDSFDSSKYLSVEEEVNLSATSKPKTDDLTTSSVNKLQLQQQKQRGSDSNNNFRNNEIKHTKRQAPCKLGEDLNEYVDIKFRFWSRIVKANEPVMLPNVTIELHDHRVNISLFAGNGKQFHKFKRTQAPWVYCNKGIGSIGVGVEFEELQANYKYLATSNDRQLYNGDLEMNMSPRFQVQYSILFQDEDSDEPVSQRVDQIRLIGLGSVQVNITGLGDQTQSLSDRINSFLNDNQEELHPLFRMLESDALKYLDVKVSKLYLPIIIFNSSAEN